MADRKISEPIRELHRARARVRAGQAEAPPEYRGERPKTRADCSSSPRPCPFAGCRYHLALNVTPYGTIQYPLGLDWMEGAEETCALDVAEQGPTPKWRLAQITGLSPMRLEDIRTAAFAKLKRHSELDRSQG